MRNYLYPGDIHRYETEAGLLRKGLSTITPSHVLTGLEIPS